MTKGKVAAQCAHAAVDCYRKGLQTTPMADFIKSWETFGQVWNDLYFFIKHS